MWLKLIYFHTLAKPDFLAFSATCCIFASVCRGIGVAARLLQGTAGAAVVATGLSPECSVEAAGGVGHCEQQNEEGEQELQRLGLTPINTRTADSPAW